MAKKHVLKDLLKEWFIVPKDCKTCRSATYREMLRYADRWDYCLLAMGIIGSFAAGSSLPITQYAFQGLVTVLINGQQKYDTGDFDKDEFVAGIQKTTCIFLGNGFFMFLANLLGNSTLFALCERQVFRFRQRFLRSVLNQDMEWFDHNEIGSLTHKINANVEKIKDGASDKLGIVIQAVGCLVSGVMFALYQSWKMTLIMLCIIPCMALSVLASAKALAASVRKEMHEYSAAGAIADEVLSGIRTVMAFNAQHFEQERYRVRLKQGRVIGIRKAALTAFFAACMQLVIFAFMSGVFYYGTMLVVYEGMVSSKVFSVFWTIMVGAMRFSNALPQIDVLLGAKAAAGELFDVIDRKPILDCTSKSGIVLQDVKGHIEFSNIHFRYPSRPEITVLNGISFEVKPGQTVALVGHSGCGKSTLVGLLMRYYTQEGGSVTLDGVPLEDVNVQWLRSVVGIVSQEPVLFQASIVDNLRLGRADVRLEDIEEACRVANAHDFISKLPQGYDTFIGEGGIKLSGGQKQRLAIARALVRQPRILLLDEATSALDTESERVVQAALDAAASGRTTITIAHRLSTVRNADRIIVFDKGTIVESGTHDELLAFDGAYKQLVAAQHVKGSTAEAVIVEEDGKEAVHSSSSSPLTGKRLSRSFSSLQSADGSNVEELQKELKLEGGYVPSACEMLRYISRDMRYFGTGFVMSVIRGCSWPAYTVVYTRMFKALAIFQADGDAEVIRAEAVTNSFLFGIIAIIAGVTTFLSGFMLGKAGETVAYRLRTSVYENLLRQDATFFDASGHSVGALTSRLSQDAANVQAAIDQRFAEVLQGFTAGVAGLIVGFVVGWNEALFCLFVALVVILIQAVISFYLKKRGIADAKAAGDASRIVTESIENVKTVQALTGQQHIFEKFGDAARAPHLRSYVSGVMMSVSIATANSYIALNFWACYLFGMWLVINDWSQPYAIFQVVEAVTVTGTFIASSASYFPEFIRARISAGIMFSMLHAQPQIDNLASSGVTKPITGDIEVEGVGFAYPNTRKVRILQDLHLRVQPGRTVALVGPSGCGKSTLIQLLERFYDVTAGALRVDGTDVRKFNVQHLRGSTALVSQEPTLFNLSIRDNIAYGLTEASDADVQAAARLANIDAFVSSLPEGYETSVGGRGTRLSGGQRQRIAIARAIIRKPKILLLDEATAALDGESERLVQEALDRASSGRTCVVVAHRLSTIQNADLICVIENGRCVETGTHQQLLERAGLYYRLVKSQSMA